MKDSKNNQIIFGKIIRGDEYGRKLGFPTVNLEPESMDFLSAGVYAGVVILEGAEYRAGIAVNPSGKIDAHLLGYNGDAYGKRAIFKISKFLREYKKFNTEVELIAQIKKDLELC